MILRDLTVADAQAFWALRLLGLQTDPSAFGSSWEESHTMPFEQVVALVAERTTGPDYAILGAFVEEKGEERLVGVTGFRRHENMKERHKSFIWGVFVHPDHRGQGIAGALLDDLIRRHAAQPGIRQIQLQVTAQNEGAVGLYASRGFQVFGREEEALFVDGRYYTDLHMVRRLDMDNAKSAQVE